MKELPKWFSDNWEWIDYWSRRWSWNHSGDLQSHLYLYLDKNWDKFKKIPDGEERIKWCQAWFKNTVRWTESDFNKSISVNNFSEDWKPAEVPSESYNDLRPDAPSEDLANWLVDIFDNWGEVGGERLMRLRGIYLELDTHRRVLFELYFYKMMSMREIAVKLNLPLSAIFTMIKDLKLEIKSRC